MGGTANFSDIVSNQTTGATAPGAPSAAQSVSPDHGTASLDDIVSNQTTAAASAPPTASGMFNFPAPAGPGYHPAPPIDPPKDSKEEFVKSVSGDFGLNTYRQARDTVEKVEGLLKSPSTAYEAGKQAFMDHLKTAYAPEGYSGDMAQHVARDQPIPPPLGGLSDALGVVRAEAAPEVAAANASLQSLQAKAAAQAGRPNPWWTKIKAAISPTAAAQPGAQAALREGAVASAADAGITAPVVAAPDAGVRTLMVKPIAEASKIEDGLYAAVNKAAETDMKSLYDREGELQDTLGDPTQIHNKAALQSELQTTQQNIAVGEAKVSAKLGTNASDLIQQAKAATQQRFAMEEVEKRIFNHESIVEGDAALGTDETINVKAALKAAQNLDKASKYAPKGSLTRLQQAFGVDGARAFKQGLSDAQQAGQTVLTRNKILGYGIPALGGVTEVVKHL